MSVTLDDVRHVAALARIGIDGERAQTLVAELNTILEHMEVLSRVNVAGIDENVDGGGGLPLRADVGPPAPLERPLEAIAPRTRDGFFLVPRLSTHEDPTEA